MITEGEESAGVPTSSHPGRDWTSLGRAAGAWALYLLACSVFLYRMLDTSIVADDYVAPFNQYRIVGFSYPDFLDWIGSSITSAGHFNYLGQYTGGAYNMGWLWLGGQGVSMQASYSVTKVAVILACGLLGARLLRLLAQASGLQLSPWVARVLVAVSLYGSLQVHIWWSNDPVASFPMSGFASAALGLLFLGEVVRARAAPSLLRASLVGLLGAAVILYYELNVASVVVAGALLLVLTVQHVVRGGRFKRLVVLSPIVVIPAVVTVGLQLLAAPGSENYGGTSFASGSGVTRTFVTSSLSSLPGAAWHLFSQYVADPFTLSRGSFLVLLVIVVVLALLWWRHVPTPRTDRRSEVRFLIAVVVAGVGFWLTATLIQASTAKIQAEVTKVGFVYSFYAFGACGIALVLAAVGRLIVERRVPVAVGVVVALLFLGFASAQYVANSRMKVQFNTATSPNRVLVDAFVEERPEAERCAALRAWTAGPWPPYYETWMVDGLNASYSGMHDAPFCSDPTAGPQL